MSERLRQIVSALGAILKLVRGDGWTVWTNFSEDAVIAQPSNPSAESFILATLQELEDNRWGEILARVAPHPNMPFNGTVSPEMLARLRAVASFEMMVPKGTTPISVPYPALFPPTTSAPTPSTTSEPLAREPRDRPIAMGDRWARYPR